MKNFLEYLTENNRINRLKKLAQDIEIVFSDDNVKKYPKIVSLFKNLEILKDNKNVALELNNWLNMKELEIEKTLSNIENNTKIAKNYIENN